MGKYRTFSQKIRKFDGACGQGNVPIRNEWQNRSKGRSQLLQQLQLLKQSSSLWLIIFALIFAVAQPVSSSPVSLSIVDENNTVSESSSRQNVSDFERVFNFQTDQRNCTPASSDEFPPDLFTTEERQHGAIAIHFFVSFYMLYALLLVCDEYFVPCINCICEDLHIPHNIAGATFMAVSTSAPELFTNVIGTFVTKGDLGVGTIVGSAVFNILAVGACIGIGTNFAVKSTSLVSTGARQSNRRAKRKGVPLDWWSLTRDSAYYLISVGTLIFILDDGRVYWQEALVMLIIYGFYIAGMCYDTQCKAMAEIILEKLTKPCTRKEPPSRKVSAVVRKVMNETLNEEDEESASLITHKSQDYGSNSNLWQDYKQIHPPLKNTTRVSLTSVSPTPSGTESDLDSSSISSTKSSASDDTTTSSSMAIIGGIMDIVSFPAKFLLSWTIPNCKKEGNRKWSGLALLCCVGWIGGLSYVISWMVCIIGSTFGIPDSVSGLTFLAAGTSFPEVLSSVIVARQGFGSMGLSNSVGSNTFDILVCLGLPWLIQSAILTAQDVDYIEIYSGGLEYSAVLLVTSLILLYIMIAANGFALDTKVGISCVIMYIIFITFACLLEMNFFFPVNLPPC